VELPDHGGPTDVIVTDAFGSTYFGSIAFRCMGCW
jgi:hypothetical protein